METQIVDSYVLSELGYLTSLFNSQGLMSDGPVALCSDGGLKIIAIYPIPNNVKNH